MIDNYFNTQPTFFELLPAFILLAASIWLVLQLWGLTGWPTGYENDPKLANDRIEASRDALKAVMIWIGALVTVPISAYVASLLDYGSITEVVIRIFVALVLYILSLLGVAGAVWLMVKGSGG